MSIDVRRDFPKGNSKMTITIFSCFEDLTGIDTGASVRIYQLAKNIASLGHKVQVVIPGADDEFEWTDGVNVRSISGLCPLRFLGFVSRLLGILRPSSLFVNDPLFIYKAMRLILNSDLVQIEQPWAAGLVIPFLIKISKRRLVVDCHDVFQSLSIERGFLRSALETFAEKVVYKIADMILVVSEEDKELLSSYKIMRRVEIIPNGVDTNAFSPKLNCTTDSGLSDSFRAVVFVGNMEYSPNREAAHIIVKNIAPKVLSKIRGVKFFLIGRFRRRMIPETENVIFTGRVDDVSEFLRVSNVAIAPLFHGSGTRLKVLEYMSCGLPVVSTKIGAEGLEVENGKDILIEDDIEVFSSRIVKLLEDRNYSAKISEAARRLVVGKYDWRKIGEKLNESYMDLFL